MRGWLVHLSRCKTIEQQVWAYERLTGFLESYKQIAVVGFDDKALNIFQQLKLQKVRVGTMDLKIASIAIANDAILISRNLKDFERIPGLAVQDWT